MESCFSLYLSRLDGFESLLNMQMCDSKVVIFQRKKPLSVSETPMAAQLFAVMCSTPIVQFPKLIYMPKKYQNQAGPWWTNFR